MGTARRLKGSFIQLEPQEEGVTKPQEPAGSLGAFEHEPASRGH